MGVVCRFMTHPPTGVVVLAEAGQRVVLTRSVGGLPFRDAAR